MNRSFSNKIIDFKRIIEMGQFFMYQKLSDREYLVFSQDKACKIVIGTEFSFLYADDIEYWLNYFDLNRNYDEINDYLEKHCKKHKDKTSLKCLKNGSKLRLCKQPFLETAIEYLLSAQNTVGNIRKAMFKIASYGTPKEIVFEDAPFQNISYNAFPTFDQLSKMNEEDFKSCGAGFRSKYIVEFIKNFKEPFGTYEEIIKQLTNYKGIGPKVANCIALYSLNQENAFPIDVWIQRYLDSYAKEKPFVVPDKYAGILQVYIYQKIREG